MKQNNIVFNRVILVLLFSFTSFCMFAQISIDDNEPIGNYENIPLYYVENTTLVLRTSDALNHRISYVLIDGVTITNNPGNYDVINIDITEYLDGKYHLIRVQYQRFANDIYGDNCYFYFTVDKNLFVNGILYFVEDGEAYVSGSFKDIEVANISEIYYEGRKSFVVSKINENSFKDRKNLKSVTIPNSVTTVGDYAFLNCDKIHSLIVGSNVNKIGDSAFSNKVYSSETRKYTYSPYNISKVIWFCNTRPSGASYISANMNYVSNRDLNLSSQYVYPFLSSLFQVGGVKFVPVSPSDRTCDIIDCVYDNEASDIVIEESINYRGIDMSILHLNDYSFYYNSCINSILINNPFNVSEYAFYGCESIATIKIKSESIGKNAFQGCTAIVKADIEANTISNGAFQNSATNESAEFSIKSESIGQDAFQGCTAIVKADIEANTISDGAFQNSAIKEPAEFTVKTESIGQDAFKGCTAIVKADVEANTIGSGAFQNSATKQEAVFTIKAETIGVNAFNGCSSIISANITSNSIGDYAFSGASSNNEATYNLYDVKTIGQDAFSKATLLKTISLNDGITNIGNNAFSGCSSLSDISLPNSVSEIGTSVLSGCSSLENVTIGTSIPELPYYTFNGCSSLGSIEIPSNILTIGDGVFSGCSSLKDVTISDRNSTLALGTNSLLSTSKCKISYKVCKTH